MQFVVFSFLVKIAPKVAMHFVVVRLECFLVFKPLKLCRPRLDHRTELLYVTSYLLPDG